MTDGRVSLTGDGEGEALLNVLSVLCIPGMLEDDRRPCVSHWCGDGEGEALLNVLSVLCIPGMLEDDRRPCVSRW